MIQKLFLLYKYPSPWPAFAVYLLKELPLGKRGIAVTSDLSHKTEEVPPVIGF